MGSASCSPQSGEPPGPPIATAARDAPSESVPVLSLQHPQASRGCRMPHLGRQASPARAHTVPYIRFPRRVSRRTNRSSRFRNGEHRAPPRCVRRRTLRRNRRGRPAFLSSFPHFYCVFRHRVSVHNVFGNHAPCLLRCHIAVHHYRAIGLAHFHHRLR